jgi:hypothetical protein
VGEPSPILPVRKTARSTGHTEGRIEFSNAFAQIENYGEITREWCVVKKWTKLPFSDSGDSGAPVVDPAGGLVGFVFGGCGGAPMELQGHDELGHVYVSYIESARMVFERLSAAFGQEVELDVVADLESLPNIVLEPPDPKSDDDE